MVPPAWAILPRIMLKGTILLAANKGLILAFRKEELSRVLVGSTPLSQLIIIKRHQMYRLNNRFLRDELRYLPEYTGKRNRNRNKYTDLPITFGYGKLRCLLVYTRKEQAAIKVKRKRKGTNTDAGESVNRHSAAKRRYHQNDKLTTDGKSKRKEGEDNRSERERERERNDLKEQSGVLLCPDSPPVVRF